MRAVPAGNQLVAGGEQGRTALSARAGRHPAHGAILARLPAGPPAPWDTAHRHRPGRRRTRPRPSGVARRP
ncbi:hypothetical protein SGPA1_10662 [Streptomyces misionensis JCM 4497]